MLSTTHIIQLRNNVWYSQLPEDFKTFINTHAQIKQIEKDQTIFNIGDDFDGLYAVLEGAVYISYFDAEGHAALSAIADPVMWFGEISLVDRQPRSHHAIGFQKTILLKIPSHDIETILEQQPSYWFHIAQLTSQKLRFAFLELVSIQTRTIQQRLAQRLLFILNGYGNLVQIENNTIHLAQDHLAKMLMCSRQTVNQELQQLEKMELIHLSFKTIEVLDVKKLSQIAQINE